MKTSQEGHLSLSSSVHVKNISSFYHFTFPGFPFILISSFYQVKQNTCSIFLKRGSNQPTLEQGICRQQDGSVVLCEIFIHPGQAVCKAIIKVKKLVLALSQMKAFPT